MKPFVVGVVLVLLSNPHSGECGLYNPRAADLAEHEKIMKDVIKAMNAMADVLDKIDNSESAKAARPKLEAVVKRLVELKKKEDTLDKLSREEEQGLKKKYASDLKKIHDRFFNAGMKLAKNGAFPEIKDIFERMQKLGS
jgi:hypothetical protein